MNLITPDRIFVEAEFDVTQPYNAAEPISLRFTWTGPTATDMGTVNLDPVASSANVHTYPTQIGTAATTHTLCVPNLKANTLYYYYLSNISSTGLSADDQSALLSVLTPEDPALCNLNHPTLSPSSIHAGGSTTLSVQTRKGAVAASNALVKFWLPDATLGSLKVRNGASGSSVLVNSDPTVLETVTFKSAKPFPYPLPYKVNVGICLVGSGCSGAPAPAGPQSMTTVVTVV